MLSPVVLQIATLYLMLGVLCESPYGSPGMLLANDKIVSDAQHSKIE
jgi:hypothetical protein